MHFSLTPANKPGHPLLAILLVIVAHILFWQLLRQQNGIPRHTSDNPVVHYLQFLQIVPPPPILETQPTAPPQVKPERALPNTMSKRQRTTSAMSVQPPATADVISPPAPPTISEQPVARQGLDLDALRSSALAIEKQRKPTEIEQIQASHRQAESLEKRLAEGTKRAEKKECLKAYSGIGLLAVIPLAVSTVVDTGCKW